MIEEVIKIARRSSIGKHQTGAIIYRDGEIISNGWSHMPHYRLNHTRSLHAEQHAIARGRHTDLTDAVIVVVTIARKSGNIVNGRPCLNCAISCNAVGINMAYHSIALRKNRDSDLARISLDAELSDLKVYPKPCN